MPGQSVLPPPSDTGAAMPSGVGSPQDKTITVTQGDVIETVTIGGAQPGQTVIVTVGGEMQTVTVEPGMTSKYPYAILVVASANNRVRS